MRDLLKDKAYFERFISENNSSNKEWLSKCNSGEVDTDRVNFVKRNISATVISIISAKYSSGYEASYLLEDFQRAAIIMNESWDGFWKIRYEGKEYDQYAASAYDEMICMLSLGYLLNVAIADFKLLVGIIDRDKVKDRLFEFIIKGKINDRPSIQEESYKDFFSIPYSYEKLRNAVVQNNKTDAEKLVKSFLEKNWYKIHKDSGWYNSHKNKFNLYFGYWSFETAAVVKIMGLDDSAFRDNQYYPKDMLKSVRGVR
jgi:hypothetical protein